MVASESFSSLFLERSSRNLVQVFRYLMGAALSAAVAFGFGWFSGWFGAPPASGDPSLFHALAASLGAVACGAFLLLGMRDLGVLPAVAVMRVRGATIVLALALRFPIALMRGGLSVGSRRTRFPSLEFGAGRTGSQIHEWYVSDGKVLVRWSMSGPMPATTHKRWSALLAAVASGTG